MVLSVKLDKCLDAFIRAVANLPICHILMLVLKLHMYSVLSGPRIIVYITSLVSNEWFGNHDLRVLIG
jgi:hypothetical protein